MTQDKESNKKFFDSLDNQHLLFTTYVYAVMGKFGVDAKEAGELIAKHYKGEY